ncbi:MAG: c-type cytochrome [Alphaproteobacteria bacterium]|nr:c-type cytochrome [Alphaproteobacteria bacterium]
MSNPSSRPLIIFAAAILGLGLSSTAFAQVDAETVFKENDCHKCHHATKAKKGPSLEAIAAKYKTKKLDEAEAIKHMTAGKKVKLEDGTEEEHKKIDTKDVGVQKAVAKWMLDR